MSVMDVMLTLGVTREYHFKTDLGPESAFSWR